MVHPDPVKQQQQQKGGPCQAKRQGPGGFPLRKWLQAQAPTCAIHPCRPVWAHGMQLLAVPPFPHRCSSPGVPIAQTTEPRLHPRSCHHHQSAVKTPTSAPCCRRWALDPRHPWVGHRSASPSKHVGRCSPQPLASLGFHHGLWLLAGSHWSWGTWPGQGQPRALRPQPRGAASPSQPYILLHMPIWSRPALWNVKKYVFLGWDPHAGSPHGQHRPDRSSGETMRPWGW